MAQSPHILHALLADAHREVVQKQRSQIEEETAFKWAARAIAAFKVWNSGGDPMMFRDSETYFNEAVEHAALADDTGAVLQAVRAWMRQHIPAGQL